jgi:hypothetical protein
LVAFVGAAAVLGSEAPIQEWHELLAENGTAGHPLVVAAPAVVIGAVEAAAGNVLSQPLEECRVVDVHSERDLRLPRVSAEVSLPHEHADEEAFVELREPQAGYRGG